MLRPEAALLAWADDRRAPAPSSPRPLREAAPATPAALARALAPAGRSGRRDGDRGSRRAAPRPCSRSTRLAPSPTGSRSSRLASAPSHSGTTALGVLRDAQVVADLRPLEALGDRALEVRDQRIEEALGGEQHHLASVMAELAERQDLGELLERAEAARQRDEGIGALVEPGLARAHVVDRVQLGDPGVVDVLLDELAQDHAVDDAARGERGVGDRAHQAGAPAAVDEHVAAARDRVADDAGVRVVALGRSRARAAEDRDAHAPGASAAAGAARAAAAGARPPRRSASRAPSAGAIAASASGGGTTLVSGRCSCR